MQSTAPIVVPIPRLVPAIGATIFPSELCPSMKAYRFAKTNSMVLRYRAQKTTVHAKESGLVSTELCTTANNQLKMTRWVMNCRGKVKVACPLYSRKLPRISAAAAAAKGQTPKSPIGLLP